MSYEKFLPVVSGAVKVGGSIVEKVMNNNTARQDMYLRYGVKGLVVAATATAACYIAHEFFKTERCAIKNDQETSFGIKKDDGGISADYHTRKHN